jgi:hypothetical protein
MKQMERQVRSETENATDDEVSLVPALLIIY